MLSHLFKDGKEGPLSIFFLPTLLFPSVGSTDRSGNRSRFHSSWQRLRQQQQQRIGSKKGHPRFLSTNDNGFFCCCGFWALSIFLPLSGAHSDPDILPRRFLQVPHTFLYSLRCEIRCTEFLAHSFQICRAVCTKLGRNMTTKDRAIRGSRRHFPCFRCRYLLGCPKCERPPLPPPPLNSSAAPFSLPLSVVPTRPGTIVVAMPLLSNLGRVA